MVKILRMLTSAKKEMLQEYILKEMGLELPFKDKNRNSIQEKRNVFSLSSIALKNTFFPFQTNNTKVCRIQMKAYTQFSVKHDPQKLACVAGA